VTAVRIMLGPMPRLMKDLLRAAAESRTDVRIVAVADTWSELTRHVAAAAPDTLILAGESPMDLAPATLLEANSGMTVLVLCERGRESLGYWVERFGALSADEILHIAHRGNVRRRMTGGIE
jgi:chemotaxis response regulator CheB